MDLDEKSWILFGNIKLSELRKRTGIPETTLSRYRRYPNKIPFENLFKIVQCRGIYDKLGELFT